MISMFVGIIFFLCGFLLVPVEQFYPDLNPSFKTIFLTNFEIHLSTIFFSIVSFGIFSLIFLFIQFFYLGFIFHSLVSQTSLKTAFSFFAGHGIIEVINMFFTSSIGFFVAVNIFYMIKHKNFNLFSIINLVKIVFILLLIDIVFLFIAALLESFLSPSLVDINNIHHLYD